MYAPSSSRSLCGMLAGDEMSQSRDEVNFTIRHKCGAGV
jgi:hypothetical protein